MGCTKHSAHSLHQRASQVGAGIHAWVSHHDDRAFVQRVQRPIGMCLHAQKLAQMSAYLLGRRRGGLAASEQ